MAEAGFIFIEILSRDPHRVTIADISTLFLDETHKPDLLERATKVSALPQNWKVQLRLRAKYYLERLRLSRAGSRRPTIPVSSVQLGRQFG